MTPKAGGVDEGAGVGVGAMSEEQVEDFALVEIDREMEQRRAGDRRAMHSGEDRILGAAQFGRIDLAQREAAVDQSGIGAEKGAQASRVAAVERHEGRVGKLVALLGEEGEDRVFAGGIPGVGAEDEGERGEAIAAMIGERGADVGEETQAGGV